MERCRVREAAPVAVSPPPPAAKPARMPLVGLGAELDGSCVTQKARADNLISDEEVTARPSSCATWTPPVSANARSRSLLGYVLQRRMHMPACCTDGPA